MRTSNSLPAPEQPSPKLCYSSTSPARINTAECEPGPSAQSDEEDVSEKSACPNSEEQLEDVNEEHLEEPNEEAREMPKEAIEISKEENNDPSNINNRSENRETKERDEKVEDLAFESWV